MRGRVRTLVLLNAAVLGALAVVTIADRAGAQPGTVPATRGERMRGDYTLVTGRYIGGSTSAVYIFDATNQELLALSWDRTHDRFNIIGHRSLAADARTRQQPR